MTPENILIDLFTQLELALEYAEVFLEQWATLKPLLAFVAGATAVIVRARLLILGALVLLGTQVAVSYEYLATEPIWMITAAGGFLLVGLLQGASVMLLGDDGGNQFMVFLFFGVLGLIVFLLWRGPRGLIVRLVRRRV